MLRKLIINADDFGLTRGINLAVSECADAGLLRSASLMANGDAFDNAVESVKEREVSMVKRLQMNVLYLFL